MTFDDAGIEKEQADIRACSSDVSTLINHYTAFSSTLEANSAIGILEQRPSDQAAVGVLLKSQSGGKFSPGLTPYVTEAHADPPLTSQELLQKLREQHSARTLVAMPAYNEENQIAKTIIGSRKYADAVLVVDDGSTDATVEIAEALGAIVIRHEVNAGYGGALKTIFKTARDIGIEELVIIDSDGQHNPYEIPRLLEKLREGYDVVIGSRFIEGMEGFSIPAYRKFGMKVLDKATTVAGGNPDISDSQSGFRAYNKRAIDKIKINGSGMSAGSEILIRVNEYGLSIGEVPIKVRYDIANTSTHNPIQHGLDIMGRLVGLVGYKRPLLSFGLPGIIFIVAGLFFGSWAFAEYYSTSKFVFSLSMVSVLLLIMGMLLVTTAFILNSLVHIVKMEQ